MKSMSGKLPPLSLEPDSRLNSNEAEEVRRRTAEYLRIVQPFNKRIKPVWLLNDWEDSTWKTSRGELTRVVGGRQIGTLDVNWEVRLPDGLLLTNPVYGQLLETCRTLAYLYRDGFAGGYVPALSTWQHFCSTLKAMCVWSVLKKGRLRPKDFGFALVDQQSLRELFVQIGTGGWTEANCLIPRCMDAMYTQAFGSEFPASIDLSLRLDKSLVGPICGWLQDQSGYVEKSKGRVSRTFLARLMHADTTSLTGASVRFNAFLRQFEPNLVLNADLQHNSSKRREYPSHRTVTVDTALRLPTSFGPGIRLAAEINVISHLYHHLPDKLIDPASISTAELKNTIMKCAADVRHTRFMPVDTGVRYLNEALLWVDSYGDDLVEYYLRILGETKLGVAEYACAKSARSNVKKKVFEKYPPPERLKNLNLDTENIIPGRQSANFHKLRQSPTLNEAIDVFVGAVVILIAMLKPSRVCEITSLARDCLISNKNYYLISQMAKRTVGGVRAETEGQPVPRIVAKAIGQLQKLGEGLIRINNEKDSYSASRLFYLPGRKYGTGKASHSRLLDHYLDQFCDFVAIQPDEFGRRWYIRIHEMRKWSLLLLYWSGREQVLDAARSLAGHSDSTQIGPYISLEFPGETRESLEALYIVDHLRLRSTMNEEELAFDDLYRRVLSHFQVAHLDLVPEREFQAYVQGLIEKSELQLTPYFLFDSTGHRKLCVAVRHGSPNGAS